MQTCPFCKYHIPDDAVVCGHCGAQKGKQEPRGIGKFLHRVGCLGMLVCGFGIYHVPEDDLRGAICLYGGLFCAALWALNAGKEVWRR